MITYDDGD